jgi:hypothetical protein
VSGNQLSTDPRHALNAVCPYFTMFPLEYPLRILKGTTARTILDPFCGRGTTLYAARLLGLRSWGVDSSKIAVAIARAKLARTQSTLALKLAEKLLRTEPREIPTGQFWTWAYDRRTLRDVCSLREGLLQRRSEDAVLLRAVCLGALHGPRSKTLHSYFSNQFPRTFAPKPAYSVRYLQEHKLRPPRVSVLEVLMRRLARLPVLKGLGSSEHVSWGDSTKVAAFESVPNSIDCFVTSPPYYGMNTYVQDQWLRNWFVGGPPNIEYINDEQLSHGSPDRFVSDLALVWANCARKATARARLHIRFGGIGSRDVDPRELLQSSLAVSCCWRVFSVTPAHSASAGRRQADQMGTLQGNAVEEFDLVAGLR